MRLIELEDLIVLPPADDGLPLVALLPNYLLPRKQFENKFPRKLLACSNKSDDDGKSALLLRL